MKKRLTRVLLITIFIIALSMWISPTERTQAQPSSDSAVIIGIVNDTQGNPIEEAQVSLTTGPATEPFRESETHEGGAFTINLDTEVPDSITVHVDRAHFEPLSFELSSQQIETLKRRSSIALPDISLERHIGVAFWIATLIFLGMLILIATELLHNALAALLGITLLFGVSYIGGIFSEELFIYNFEQAIDFVDWEVIFLIMGMMMFIAVIERTGIFQWLAFWAYKISQGKLWLLLPILMLITGVASAFLDNVTTMLLMTPISVQIALAMGISPLALLVPEVMASNVIGISTLIGTPTNILIGTYANISFADFLVNLTPGVLLAFIGLVLYSEWTYRKELHEAGDISERLLERLEEDAKITERSDLQRAGLVGLIMLVLFIFGEAIHLTPAVTALMGATVLLVWIRPDLEEMIESVDWTTLVFFMSLFIVIGAIEEVGLISMIADFIGSLVGENLVLAVISIIWFGAIMSGLIDNIPFTAAMLPVVGYLTRTIPGADNLVLFYALSVGAAMGGNGTLIGSSPNLVTAGISERAGYPITYMYFLKKGFPAMVITVAIGTLWILFHFL